jgi:ubiquinone/menaquinone biosynthesis C-methylase UbiE
MSRLFLRERVGPGSRVVDATCGNGRDTLLLAELVGPHGKVWGFDIQQDALDATAALLEAAGCRDRVELVHAGHENLAKYVSGSLDALIFNLGYLPGGDKRCVTTPRESLAAMAQGVELLTPGGRICIVIYTGHPGGAGEAAAVESWAGGLPPKGYHVWSFRQLNRSCSAPYVILVEKAR